MSTRFPEPADPFEEQGQSSPDPDNETERLTGDAFDDPAVAAEESIESEDWGMTAEEEVEGEPLDGRLSRELPDTSVTFSGDDLDDSVADPFPDADERVGRLVAPDEGAHDDEETDEVAESVGTDQGGFTAEERAMHIDPER